MRLFIFLGTLITVSVENSYQQGRVAPGVPPQKYQQQQYQQPPPQYQAPQYQQQQQYQQQPQYQQQHQQPQQYQQQPQQHQPPPQAQNHPPQQVHQQHQQPPPQHGGHHHDGHKNQVLNAGNIHNEREHIAEHFEVPMDTSKMSEQELQFHYFKMHDSDNNNKLDGCELIKSLIHWHEEQGAEKKTEVEVEVYDDERLSNLVDSTMKMDQDNDGYINWAEYLQYKELTTLNN